MDPAKKAKFFAITKAYKGNTYSISSIDELYRERKIYSFYKELCQQLSIFWRSLRNAFYAVFYPVRNLHISFDRLAAKMAFCPPRDTYVFTFEDNKWDNGQMLLRQYATQGRRDLKSYLKIEKIMKHLECFSAYSKHGNRIACAYITCETAADKTVVYSHTNAEDVGSILLYLYRMRKRLKQNMFFYDYSGFGMSSGCPSERNLHADIETAVGELCRRKSLKPHDLVLFGESIGSVPTVHMATKIDACGVILQSAFMSALRIYLPYEGKTLLYDPLANIERMPLIKSKTLIIHVSEDALVDISQAVAMYRALKNASIPFWANGHGHMNIYRHPNYYDRINYFINFELGN